MKKLILVVSTIALLCSCKSTRIQSLAMVGKSYSDIKANFREGHSFNANSDLEVFEKGDTLLVLSFLNDTPFEAIYLFKNETCYFLELNIYCSPCADQAIDAIIDDKNYKFQAIDPVNYLASKNPNVIMRLKEKLNDIGNCNQITINKVK